MNTCEINEDSINKREDDIVYENFEDLYHITNDGLSFKYVYSNHKNWI